MLDSYVHWVEAQCSLPGHSSVLRSILLPVVWTRDVLKKNEPILLHIGTSDGQRGKGMKRLGDQGSRSQDAEVTFGSLAEALFWTPFGQVGFSSVIIIINSFI